MVNTAIARYAQAPVLLVGDIDRGGIFAQLLGTLWLLEPEEQALVQGLIVNKFRGDPDLFVDGVRILEERGGVPVLGVVPYLHDVGIPEEDGVALEMPDIGQPQGDGIDVAVVRLPRIANFDDFDPLDAEPGVQIRYVTSPRELGQPQAVILPGTKSTIADLTWLREQGLAAAIRQLAERGTAIVGVCGGYQMLGHVIQDPEHVESSEDEVTGLGLLPLETVFQGEKATHRVQARVMGGVDWLAGLRGQIVQGYEIHMGQSHGGQPWIEIIEQSRKEVSVQDGAMSDDGRVWGCYLHGLFGNDHLRRAWLSTLGWRGDGMGIAPLAGLDAAFDRLADAVEASLDMEVLDALVQRE
jgi:adenosylcobyric acid synthase